MSDKPGDKSRTYIERVRQDAQRYAQELLDDNQRLRAQVVTLEAEKARLAEQVQSVRDEAERASREQAELQQRLAQVQTESREFAEQFIEVERQNANLANLYVASYQLHGTLERDVLLQTVQEILANLVGSEEAAVFELAEDGATLKLVSWSGIDAQVLDGIPVGEGVIGGVAASGETWVVGQGAPATGREAQLTACVPLKLEERVTGAIAIFRLLPQKPALEPGDHELFDLLATHAAMALYCTGLHGRLAR